MNFESFRAKVRASALKAAEAAMSVSSLDQMAADDEYIHSEGLKVSKSKNKKTATASQQLNELIPLPSTEHVQRAQQLQPFPAKPPIKSQSSLHVADAMKDRQRRPTQTEKHDDDDGSDDDDDDLIMSMIRRTPATVEPRPSKTKLKQVPPNPGPVQAEHIPTKKNPNRFMSDLDDRLSKVEEARPEATIAKQQTSSAPSSERNSWNLLQSAVATSSMGQFLSQKLVVPIAATDEERKPMKGPLVSRRDHGAGKDNHEEEDPFQVVVSSSVLGADEAAELERMRLATQQSTGPCAMVWHTIRQNPHHAFIVFTLLLGSAAYFYSRHRGSEDDVS
jgi:hypothetical protein